MVRRSLNRRSLNQSIFRLIVGIVVVTSLTILVNVWMAMTDHARQRLERDLVVAQNVLEQVLRNREEQLYNSADVLAADFGFKQAVATREAATISSALQNQGQRIDADVMALLTLDGETVTSTPPSALPGGRFPHPQLIASVVSEGGVISMMVLDGRLYQVVMLTVDAPTPIAIALIGFAVDRELMQSLQRLTQLETSISVIDAGEEIFRVSTLPDSVDEHIIPGDAQTLWWLGLVSSSRTHYVSRQFDIATVSAQQIRITLSENVDSLFSEFGKLLSNIFLIALAAIALALLFASHLSRKLAQPLTRLAGFAQRISRGDYSQSIDSSSNSLEFDNLAEALASMQVNIRDRESEIIHQAQHDDLTGLINRHHIGELLEQKIQAARSFRVVAINIVDFRGINDVFGYQNGDVCLQLLAERLSSLSGLAARLAGGELLWIPENLVPTENLAAVKKLLEQPLDTGQVTIEPKVSIGVITCPDEAQTAEDLFRRINIVLDETLHTGHFILDYHPDMEGRYLHRLRIISELKNTLVTAQHELSIVYQPKLAIASSTIIGAEALIRWNNAALGFVPPDDFIPIAESTGLIEGITDWVLDRVISDLGMFQAHGIILNVAINLSAKDLMNARLADNIAQRVANASLDCSQLSFEITEGDMVRDAEAAIAHLQLFRDQGFSLAIDDFGTGYSSMAYLQRFPVDTIKIDKAFVLQLDTAEGDQRIVQTVIELAHGFAMNVVAEGVENSAALTMLRHWGCEIAQGYLICKPLPPEQFIDWFRDNQQIQWLEQNV